MKKRNVIGGSVFCILAMVIIFGGMAIKAEAASIKLSMADFTNDGWSASDYFKNFDNAYIQGGYNSGGSACLVAPVKLTGFYSKLKSVYWYLENDSSSNFDVYFYGVNMTTGAVFYNIDGYSPPDVPNVIEGWYLTPSPSYAPLYKNYQYYLGICIYPDQYFYGAQINY